MDTPATLRKRPASLALNAEARQPTAKAGNIYPPRPSRSAPAPPSRRNSYLTVRFKVSVVEWQRKNKTSTHRTDIHFSIEGGRNRERKCRIPRISPPPLRFVLRLRLQKLGKRICGTLRYRPAAFALLPKYLQAGYL